MIPSVHSSDGCARLWASTRTARGSVTCATLSLPSRLKLATPTPFGQVPSAGDVLYGHYIQGVHVPKLERVVEHVHEWLYGEKQGRDVVGQVGKVGAA